mmetsp:Transcript_54586/g.145825  ORF Transcript_54586/g.145825 Transcript_54586/m.145825 type:complete len:274 (+) Transcript_54586:1047-1868(+)
MAGMSAIMIALAELSPLLGRDWILPPNMLPIRLTSHLIPLCLWVRLVLVHSVAAVLCASCSTRTFLVDIRAGDYVQMSPPTTRAVQVAQLGLSGFPSGIPVMTNRLLIVDTDEPHVPHVPMPSSMVAAVSAGLAADIVTHWTTLFTEVQRVGCRCVNMFVVQPPLPCWNLDATRQTYTLFHGTDTVLELVVLALERLFAHHLLRFNLAPPGFLALLLTSVRVLAQATLIVWIHRMEMVVIGAGVCAILEAALQRAMVLFARANIVRSPRKLVA